MQLKSWKSIFHKFEKSGYYFVIASSVIGIGVRQDVGFKVLSHKSFFYFIFPKRPYVDEKIITKP